MGGVQIELARLEKFLSGADLHKLFRGSINALKVKLDTARLDHRPRARLTPAAIVTLAQLGHWVDIPPQHIEDRSKANGIQKSLILVQVSWMLVSCIARKAYGLPLTLLEIHTMVHVVCAFFIYFFWFKVGQPILLLLHGLITSSGTEAPRHTRSRAEGFPGGMG